MPTLKIHIEMRLGLLVLAQGLVRFQFLFWFQHLSSSQRQHVDRYLQGVEVEEVEDVPPEEPPVPLLDDELKLADSRFEAWKSEVGKRGCEMNLSFYLYLMFLRCCCLLVKPFPLCGAGKVADMKCLCRFLPTSSNCPSTSCPKGQKSSVAMQCVSVSNLATHFGDEILASKGFFTK